MTKHMSYPLNEEELNELLAEGGYDDTEATDDVTVFGNLPTEEDENPTWSMTVNDEETGYGTPWLELPASVREWCIARK